MLGARILDVAQRCSAQRIPVRSDTVVVYFPRWWEAARHCYQIGCDALAKIPSRHNGPEIVAPCAKLLKCGAGSASLDRTTFALTGSGGAAVPAS
jgi:hypothetical protein